MLTALRTRAWKAQALACLLLVGGLGGAAVLAQNQPQMDDESEPHRGYTAMMDNLDLLVDNYCNFLARKYDLTEEQDLYTRRLMREKTNAFINSHEPELRTTVSRLFEVRSGGAMTQEELQKWGEEVRPLYEQAKQVIVDGNNEWREILTEPQRRIHDEDVREMYESFSTTEAQLDDIAAGRMTVADFRNPRPRARQIRQKNQPPQGSITPPPQTVQASPPPQVVPPEVERGMVQQDPRDAEEILKAKQAEDEARGRAAQAAAGVGGKGTAGQPAARSNPGARRGGAKTPATQNPTRRPQRANNRPAVAGKGDMSSFESEWEQYTKQFIERYKLDDEQKTKAMQILKDCQDQGNRYVTSRKARIEAIDEELKKLGNDANAAEQRKKLTEQRGKLLDPLTQIFERQLKPRLEKLPTRAQRRDAENPPKPAAGEKK